ncbi:MAG: helix-turn-helix domain-containing protein [Planctomycetota bacterium]|jgi:hypothetical protein
MTDTKLLLSPEEIQNIYGIKVATLAQWRWQRRGPDFFKLGALVKYKATEFEEWLERNRYKNKGGIND